MLAGASDCASCVAVALELARLIVADGQIRLAAPVVFLLNGGEEAFLLGAHAFTAHSGYRTGLGAFVNLYVSLAYRMALACKQQFQLCEVLRVLHQYSGALSALDVSIELQLACAGRCRKLLQLACAGRW